MTETCVHGFSPRCPGCEEARDAAWKRSGGIRRLLFGDTPRRYSPSRVWDANDDGTWKEIGS